MRRPKADADRLPHYVPDVPVDWAATGVTTDDGFAGLAEVLMRLFLSFLQHPSTPTVIDDQLRAWSSTGSDPLFLDREFDILFPITSVAQSRPIP